MPDLNELLRWSIQNSDHAQLHSQAQQAPQPQPDSDEPLELRFNPASDSPSIGSSAIHPSDPHYRSVVPQPPSPPSGTTQQTANAAPTSSINTEILDMILGSPDSTVMKEKMGFAKDESLPVDERVEALDDFEMLIENLDNANNMATLKLWEPLLSLLSSSHESIIAHACWIIGTAVQNNLKAQAALYANNALPQILDIIYPASSSSTHSHSTRSRGTYALSSALKHWPLATAALLADSARGYETLKKGVRDEETVVRRKMSFLVGTLVLQSGEEYQGEIPKEVGELVTEHVKSGPKESLLDGLKSHGVLSELLEGLRTSSGDIEYDENAFKSLLASISKGVLSDSEKSTLRDVWNKWGKDGQAERGFEGEQVSRISTLLN